MIHKVAARRCRYKKVHRGRASVGTDVRVDGMVAVRVKHAIDRGRRKYAVHKASCPSLDIEG